MNIIILLASVVCVSSSPVFEKYEVPTYNNLTYFLVEVAPGVYQKEDLTVVSDYKADVSDVKIYFHSKNTGNNDILVDLTDTSSLSATDFSNSKNTIFIIHGWHNDHSAPVNVEIRQAYLSVQDVNIFIVDWSSIAKWGYVLAQSNVEDIGKIVGSQINGMVENFGLELGKTVLIGHSLGAHIAGVAGNTIGDQAEHIVGLDPAGPLFSMDKMDNRIDSEDAKFVQIIHSNAGLLGMNHHLGHADYWPNGGKTQPGCEGDITGSCSHSRSYEYYAESIKTGKFASINCDDWETYESGSCDGKTESYMGQNDVDKSANGDYYLTTNSESPYAKGE